MIYTSYDDERQYLAPDYALPEAPTLFASGANVASTESNQTLRTVLSRDLGESYRQGYEQAVRQGIVTGNEDFMKLIKNNIYWIIGGLFVLGLAKRT